jgi:predicted dinucleotide-binding enzyme
MLSNRECLAHDDEVVVAFANIVAVNLGQDVVDDLVSLPLVADDPRAARLRGS